MVSSGSLTINQFYEHNRLTLKSKWPPEGYKCSYLTIKHTFMGDQCDWTKDKTQEHSGDKFGFMFTILAAPSACNGLSRCGLSYCCAFTNKVNKTPKSS